MESIKTRKHNMGCHQHRTNVLHHTHQCPECGKEWGHDLATSKNCLPCHTCPQCGFKGEWGMFCCVNNGTLVQTNPKTIEANRHWVEIDKIINADRYEEHK